MTNDVWLTLPAEAYVRPEVLQEEAERIFRRTWQLACHESDLPQPGSFLVFDLLQRFFARAIRRRIKRNDDFRNVHVHGVLVEFRATGAPAECHDALDLF